MPGVLRVDRAGLLIDTDTDRVVDVRFDGRRIWSFWTLRDTTEPDQAPGRLAAWPAQLERFLDGHTRLSVVDHLTEEVWYDEHVALGDGSGRILVEDAHGNALGIDKAGKIMQTFDTRGPAEVASLMDAIEAVAHALDELGVAAFVSYGTLLGTVRDGHLIGHDSDADLGYLSRHEHPFDVIMESMSLRRAIEQRGWHTKRYSSAAFKILVDEADGSVRGLDVFGGFLMNGDFHLMGEVCAPFERDWLVPLGVATLEGRQVPVPAAPERLLDATYGPGWQVPDPAYKYETPRATDRRLSGWFREGRIFQRRWDRRLSPQGRTLPSDEPSTLARLVEGTEGVPERLLDLGWGRGGDARWFAGRGTEVTGYDYVSWPSTAVRRRAAQDQLPLTFRSLNLLDIRSWMSEATRLAHEPGPRTITCRHVIEATTVQGRDAVWRFASMVLREGGRLYVEFLSGPRRSHGSDLLAVLPAELVIAEIKARGGAIAHREEGVEDGGDRPVCRLVVEWPRPTDQHTTGRNQ